jgi:hypothetical protein
MTLSYTASRILDVHANLNAAEVEKRIAYGTFASLEDGFVYVEIPKAACTTLKTILRELNTSSPLKLFVDTIHETRRTMFVHARENVPLPPLNALTTTEQQYLLDDPDVLRFTVVRNPYTRLLSAWHDKVLLCEPCVDYVYSAVRGTSPRLLHKDPIEFSEFLTYIENTADALWDPHWRRQVDLAFPDAIKFTHIGKVEQLSNTLTLFFRHLGRDFPDTVPHINESIFRSLATYSENLAQRVFELYKPDFSAFGYTANSWPRDSMATDCVSQERIIDEIFERNVIISHLYNERDRLKRGERSYRISLVRIQEKLADFKSKLDEIGEALTAEMGKPIQRRDPSTLAFLVSQREKFAFASTSITEIANGCGDVAASLLRDEIQP